MKIITSYILNFIQNNIFYPYFLRIIILIK